MRLGATSKDRAALLAPMVAAAALLAAAGAAQATPGPWLKLDRVEAEPTWLQGIARLRIYVTAVEVHGAALDVHSFTLQIDGAASRRGYLPGRFAHVDDDLAIVLVLETGYDYANVLPVIQEEARVFVQGLAEGAQVGVVGYGEEIDGSGRLRSPQDALRYLADLESEPVPGHHELIKAVATAVRILRNARPPRGRPLRRAVVVVSDGIDAHHTAERFRSVSRLADRSQIRIHTIAFSAQRLHRPMLGLGEMSKLTHGTFRLVATRDGFKRSFTDLRRELENQYVLTYFAPVDTLEGSRIKVGGVLRGQRRATWSNEIKLGHAKCGNRACGEDHYCAAYRCLERLGTPPRGFFGWAFLIGAAFAAVFAALWALGSVLARPARRPPVPAGRAAEARDPTPHRIVPHRRDAPSAGTRDRSTGSVTLLVLSGKRRGERIAVRDGLVIGSAPSCDLVLEDEFASGRHAQIVRDEGTCEYTLVDLGSTNGTFVNGVRTATSRLTSGMALRVGATHMRFFA